VRKTFQEEVIELNISLRELWAAILVSPPALFIGKLVDRLNDRLNK